MAKKPKEPKDLSGLYEAIEECWAGGAGFLAKGDKAYLTSDRAKELLDEKKIKKARK